MSRFFPLFFRGGGGGGGGGGGVGGALFDLDSVYSYVHHRRREERFGGKEGLVLFVVFNRVKELKLSNCI